MLHVCKTATATKKDPGWGLCVLDSKRLVGKLVGMLGKRRQHPVDCHDEQKGKSPVEDFYSLLYVLSDFPSIDFGLG